MRAGGRGGGEGRVLDGLAVHAFLSFPYIDLIFLMTCHSHHLPPSEPFISPLSSQSSPRRSSFQRVLPAAILRRFVSR